MPAGKSSDSSATLYAMITFVVLFLITLVCTIIFYNKSENYRIQEENTTKKIRELVSVKEQSKLDKIVGKRLKNKTYLGTMKQYLDELFSAITGLVPEDSSAQTQMQTIGAKVTDAKMRINDTLEYLAEDVSATWGPDGVDLLRTIVDLKHDLDAANNSARNMETLLDEVQQEYDDDAANWRDEEQMLIDQKDRIQKAAEVLHAEYNGLKELMERSTEEQVRAYMDKLDGANEKLEQSQMDLLKVQAELDKTNQSLQIALNTLEEIKPRPDVDVLAYKPDASIVSVEGNVAYIDIGSRDHVYAGLTFSVYDKNIPIPKDGKGKAEIEVFQVSGNASAARILTSSKKNAIVPEDIVANLIWDTAASNTFVVSGTFDFDGDGFADRDGKERVIELIERWNGRIVDDISIRTDFIVLGMEPKVMIVPTSNQIDIDPTIEQKYERMQQAALRYDSIIEQAKTFMVPVFNQKRFMNLIGYESTARKSKPF